MNAFTEQQLEAEVAAGGLTPSVVRAARLRSFSEQRSVCAVLEDELSLAPDALLRALGHALQHAVADSRTLSTWTPAFDRIGYADAVRHGCLAFRDGDESQAHEAPDCRSPGEAHFASDAACKSGPSFH